MDIVLSFSPLSHSQLRLRQSRVAAQLAKQLAGILEGQSDPQAPRWDRGHLPCGIRELTSTFSKIEHFVLFPHPQTRVLPLSA